MRYFCILSYPCPPSPSPHFPPGKRHCNKNAKLPYKQNDYKVDFNKKKKLHHYCEMFKGLIG